MLESFGLKTFKFGGSQLIVMSPSLLFFQPITNLVWNRCRSAQNKARSQVTLSAREKLSTLLDGGVGGGGGGGGG